MSFPGPALPHNFFVRLSSLIDTFVHGGFELTQGLGLERAGVWGRRWLGLGSQSETGGTERAWGGE